MNLISGNRETSSRPPAFSLFLPGSCPNTRDRRTVIDRSGNVVGIVYSKLDAIKAANVTGDIPQNVNFAIQSSIMTSLLDSYAIDYQVGALDREKSTAEIVSAALPAIFVIECMIDKSATASTMPLPPSPTERSPSPGSQDAPREEQGLHVVRAFYDALGRADGVNASKLVIPEKRLKGAFAASEISNFYSSLREPLRLLEIKPSDTNVVDVRYQYESADRRACQGRAVVNLTLRGNELLIEAIRALDRC